ncbi:MAG: glycosyltransferase family 2 protein [Brevinematales bacterium]|jgi:glycosyltransferase involved in cell wall biosynthesis
MPDINYCVIIPTYNNGFTLEKVILSVMEFTSDIIAVNDGSTDNTSEILESFGGKIKTVSYPVNRGKGAALRAGFKRALEEGYEFAITMDSDGQHYASDISKFLEKAVPGKDILIIGNRDMSDANIPKKSLFGRKFSNFWVKLETGLDMKDSQSGYRLYTVKRINRFHYFTKKYDFELESLVRWIWRGLPVEIVTIGVYYPPAGERVSHFRAFRDNFIISLLNVALVAITLSYIIPGKIFRITCLRIKKILSFGGPNEVAESRRSADGQGQYADAGPGEFRDQKGRDLRHHF